MSEVKTKLRRRLHTPIPLQGAYLRAVMVAHTRYYTQRIMVDTEMMEFLCNENEKSSQHYVGK
jgi:hypothetical protein